MSPTIEVVQTPTKDGLKGMTGIEGIVGIVGIVGVLFYCKIAVKVPFLS